MNNCIFCKINKGEVPCYKVYENNKAIAFLDIQPFAKGYTLVIPKNHFQDIHDIPEKDLQDVTLAIKHVAKILKEKLNVSGINILQRNGKGAGQEVMHLHFHLIPRFKNDKVNLEGISRYEPGDLKELLKLLTN